MTSVRSRFLISLAAFTLILTLGSVQGIGQVQSVGDVARGTSQFAGQTVTVRGTLQILAGNYFRDPHFVLSDEQGNRVSVSPWVPLEVPPIRPGSRVQGRPLTMRDFLGHTVALTGTVRLTANGAGPLLEVRSGAIEPGSVRKSAMATGPAATSQPVSAGLSQAGRGSGPARILGSTTTVPVSSVQTGSVQPLRVTGVSAVSEPSDPASAGVNLLPFKPSTWSDKIVVSAMTGTLTDDSSFYADVNLYVDWAVINDGDTATASRFYVQIYVDEVLKTTWYVDPPLGPLYYVYDNDYVIGALSAGSHTIRIKADSTNAIAESNESDNEYTKTINVVSGGTVNLTPYAPGGWSDKIVVSNVAGTTTDSSPLYSTDILYIDWAAVNNGTSTISAAFSTELYIDNVLEASWSTNPPLGSSYFVYLSDYAVGPLTAGNHNIKVKVDSTNAVLESNEADNEYTRTITVTADTMPNLAPYKPSGWSDRIVASSVAGTHTDQPVFCVADPIYIDWAVINKGGDATASRFYTELYVDGILKTSWYTDPPLNPGNYVSNSDYALGSLSVGVHAIKIKTDSTGVIGESKENDNEYTKSIRVVDDCGIATRKSLVLIVDFSDNVGQVSPEYFRQIMFGSYPSVAPLGSLADFYLEGSYQKLLVGGDVNTPDIAWIRLPQTYAYYTYGAYGTDGAYPHNAQKMVEDAAIAAKNLGLDFGPYDDNLDGYVDSLFVVHAGPGAEFTSNENDIWSHAWVTSYAVNTGSVNALGQAVKVWRYSTEPEYWDSPGDMTMGVFSHEFGHVLGLPDLYDTDYSSEGVGSWSLMAGGSWNGPSNLGDSPAHMDPRSKWYLGWLTPTRVTSYQAGVSIRTAEDYPDIFQFLSGSAGPGDASGEYFLVENRQQTKFDTYLPGSGLLIWHIDESVVTDNAREWYPGCVDCTGHYHVALIQADNHWDLENGYNRGDLGDPFPGSSGNTSFASNTSPNSALYSGSQSGVSVTAISASAATMTATFSVSGYPLNVGNAGAGSGTVTSSPAGINCGSACSSSFDYNTVVTLSASPATGSSFVGWSGEGCGGTGTCQVTMSQARTVTATFQVNNGARLDFDKSGSDDVAVYRWAQGIWYVLLSPGNYTATSWGSSSDSPVPGDYDGDGKTDIGVWRTTNGMWYLLPSSLAGSYRSFSWGAVGDIPVPADYDGDGITDAAVWRPSTGQWFILPSASPGAYKIMVWGASGDKPVPADYDGDGQADPSVWRPDTGYWYILLSGTPGAYRGMQWGLPDDLPVQANYDGQDGDGRWRADIAVYRPSNGNWYILPSNSPGTYRGALWGNANDIPAPADYDGDSKSDIAIWRPSTGVWYILPSSAPGTYWGVTWGTSEDVPVSSLAWQNALTPSADIPSQEYQPSAIPAMRKTGGTVDGILPVETHPVQYGTNVRSKNLPLPTDGK